MKDKIIEARKKRAEHIQAMQSLHDTAAAENRDLNDDEVAAWEKHRADAEALAGSITRMEAQDALNAEMAAPTSAPLFKGGAGPAVVGKHPDNQNVDETGFKDIGAFMHSITKVAQGHVVSEELKQYDFRGEMNTATGSEGGFLIPRQFSDQLLSVDPMESIVRSRATVIPAGEYPDAPIDIPTLDQSTSMYGGVQFKWTNETATKQNSGKPSLGQVSMQPKEVSGLIYMGNKLLNNKSASAALITMIIRQAYAAMEDQSFLFGDGIGKPLGMLVSQAVKEVNRAVANQVSYQDTLDMLKNRMPNGKYAWLYTLDTETELAKLQDAAGQYIFKQTANEDIPAILHGRPGLINDRVPSLGTAGDLSLVDFSKYLIKDGSGMYIDVSKENKFAENQTVFRLINNVDGQPWMKGPAKLDNGLDVHPFIKLIDPAA